MRSTSCAPGFVHLAFALLLLGAAPQASAEITYRYTSPLLVPNSDQTPPSGSYTGTERVVVTLTLANPIPANASNLDIAADLLEFSFSDGRSLVTTGGFIIADVTTDALGNPTNWVVNISTVPDCTPQGTAAVIAIGFGVAAALVQDCDTGQKDTANVSGEGTWSARGDLVSYRFTGSPFETFVDDDTPPIGMYTTEDRIVARLLYALPLPPNFAMGGPPADAPPIGGFWINDGRRTITSTRGTPRIWLRTDAAGDIDAWNILVNDAEIDNPTADGEQLSWVSIDSTGLDFALIEACCPLGEDSALTQTNGAWALVPRAVPGPGLPGSIVLAALLALVAGRRLRARSSTSRLPGAGW